MDPAAALRTAEFLVVDTETNGLAGDACELTEVGAVLVGGGELHDRWETLVGVRAPLGRGIQRFTGITQAMVDEAPAAELALPELADLMRGRVLVAHNASFDRRVLQQAFRRADVAWPQVPVLCTVALARRLAPLVRQRKLALLAGSLGIDVEVSHRALADAETCARVFCALFGRLCAHASTVEEAVALTRPAKPSRRRAGRTDGGRSLRGTRRRAPDLSGLPETPGVYVFRNDAGQPLYVGKSVTLRSRARAHFAASSPDSDWAAQAELVDHTETPSELGALLLEHAEIRRLRPPGNVRMKHQDAYVYLRCRLDIAYPILELAPEPAAGRAINIGPLRGRHAAAELLEQLNSLFGLRHCGRGMPRRAWPSAYGQMGRCLSPCLGDLDPNLYRRRLDQALGVLEDGGGALLDHVSREMLAASQSGSFERAGWLQRRRARLAVLLERIGGVLEATHVRPRLVLALGKDRRSADAVWLVGGRIAAHAEVGAAAELADHTLAVLRRSGGPLVGPVHRTPDEVAAARIVGTWCALHDPPALGLDPAPDPERVMAFARAAGLRGVRVPV